MASTFVVVTDKLYLFGKLYRLSCTNNGSGVLHALTAFTLLTSMPLHNSIKIKLSEQHAIKEKDSLLPFFFLFVKNILSFLLELLTSDILLRRLVLLAKLLTITPDNFNLLCHLYALCSSFPVYNMTLSNIIRQR